MAALRFPLSLDEACELLSRHRGEARVIAGGVALMVLVRHQLFFPANLISLKRIAGLDRIDFDDTKGLRIGAMVTHHAIESSPIVQRHYPALAQCVHHVGNLRVRNMGTLLGDLCQGDNHSDPAPLLDVLGAKIKVRSLKGERLLSMENFQVGLYETGIEEGEIATELVIPPPPPDSRTVYLRFAGNSAMDWPLLGVAGSARMVDGQCQDLKLSLGGLTEVPVSLNRQAEALRGKKPSPGKVRKFADSCAAAIDPLPDDRASSWYKKRLAAVYLQRTVQRLLR